MPADIKLHAFKGTDNGTGSCDYRDEKFIGAEQGDHHRTIAEIEDATEEQVALALRIGPEINRLFDDLVPSENITALLDGDEVGLRIGVWSD